MLHALRDRVLTFERYWSGVGTYTATNKVSAQCTTEVMKRERERKNRRVIKNESIKMSKRKKKQTTTAKNRSTEN